MSVEQLDHLYEQVLTGMEKAVNRLASQVSPPQRVRFKESFVFRHVEKSIEQAIVQKLARMVSTLHAARLLLDHGFVQEQGALQRVLDEILDDIMFLTLGVISNQLTPLHKKYLEAFFEEEFDDEDPIKSTQKRPMILRRKIHAYNSRAMGTEKPQSQVREVLRTISKAYSGYVHAASPHIMEMCVGDPPRFLMRGMANTRRQDDSRKDLWNYFYRGTMACGLAAMALRDAALASETIQFVHKFDRIGCTVHSTFSGQNSVLAKINPPHPSNRPIRPPWQGPSRPRPSTETPAPCWPDHPRRSLAASFSSSFG